MITLWLVTILSVLAVAIGRYLSTEVRLTKFRLARAQAKALARSGVYLAMQQLKRDGPEEDGKAYDWLGDEWAHDAAVPWVVDVPSDPSDPAAPPHTITVTMTDEQRKLNINAVTAAQLESLLGSQPLAQEIVDYIDQDNAGEQPVEDPPFFQKNESVAALEELRDVPGMTPEMFARLAASTAVFPSGSNASVNINTVESYVLRAIGLNNNTIQAISQFRETGGRFTQAGVGIATTLEDHGVVLEDEQKNLLVGSLFGVSSQLFAVVSEGAVVVSGGVVERPTVRVQVQAVVLRQGCAQGIPAPCLIAWREG